MKNSEPPVYPPLEGGHPIPAAMVRRHTREPRQPHPMVVHLSQAEHGDSIRALKYRMAEYRYAAGRLGFKIRWKPDGSTPQGAMVRIWFLNPALITD